MWAGGRIDYHERSAYVGENVTSFSFIQSKPVIKKSSKGTNLLFTTVETQYYSKDSNTLLMTETVDYVYKEGDGKGTAPAAPKISFPPIPKLQVNSVETKTEKKTPQPSKLLESSPPMDLDEIALFRFSALTWNSHKIHYDKAYAQHDGHENILVHGPLQATILLDLLENVSRHEISIPLMPS